MAPDNTDTLPVDAHGCEYVRDRLERVRSCSMALDSLHSELEALRYAEREVVPWTPCGSGSGPSTRTHSDPTATVAASRAGLADRIERLVACIEEAERVVGEGLRLIDMVRGGLGAAHADVLEIYYIDGAATWSEVAEELGVSRMQVWRLRNNAYEWIENARCYTL